MSNFLTKPLSTLERAAGGQSMATIHRSWPSRLTKYASPGFLFNSPAGGVTGCVIGSDKERPVPSAARTASTAFHSRLTFWKKLLPLMPLFAALVAAAACGDGDSESPPALGATSETSSGVSPSSATRAVATPTAFAVSTNPTLSAGSSATGRAGSRMPTPTPVPASTPGTNTLAGRPTQTASGTPDPSETESDAIAMAGKLADYGQFYVNNGRYHRAVQVLDRAIEDHPDFAQAHALRGAAYAGLREFDKALEDLDKAIDLDPSDAVQAHLTRSNVYIQLGEYDNAIQDSEDALAGAVRAINDRTSEPVRSQKQSRAASNAMAVAFYRAGNYSDYENYFRGDLVYRIEGDYEAGVVFRSPFEEQHSKMQEINNTLILEPDNGGLYFQRAQVFADIGWPEKAVEDYTKAFELWKKAGVPDQFDRRERGRAYVELRQYDLAVDDIRKMELLGRGTESHLDPELHASVAARLARQYLNARSVEEAVRVMNDYGHDPNDFVGRNTPLINYVVFMGFLHAAQGDFDAAEEYLNVYFCDSTQRQCAYPDGIQIDQNLGALSMEQIGVELWRTPSYAPVADEIDTISLNRYISRLGLHMHHIEYGPGRYYNLLASEVLMEQAPDLPDGHIANSVAHLGSANLKISAAKDAETAQAMLDHYDQSAESYETFQSLAGTDDILIGKAKLVEAYRVLALGHLGASVGPPDAGYRQEHFELAGAAFEKYAELTEPDREFRAAYAFSRGRVLASWRRTEDAQAAYKQAFDLGYDRRDVEQALADLSNR